MAVYLVNILLILFWRLYFTQKRFPDARKYFCTVAAFQWILISGLRDWSIGADTYNYYGIFEQVKSTSWGAVLKELFDYVFHGLDANDPGYTVLTKLFQVFSGDYQIFLLAIAAFFMTLMAKWIYKHSASPCTSFILFSTLFYSFYAITGHRQAIATALIVFVGYDLIRERKLLRFAVVSLVSFLIHKSSLVFVPFYFLTQIRITPVYMGICAVGIALITILGQRIYGPIALWIGYSESQVSYSGGGAELYAVLLSVLCLVTLFLYPRIKRHREDAHYLFHATTMALMSALLVIQNQAFMRIQQYYSLFLMITIPEVINVVKKEYRLLVYLLFGLVLILYLIRNNPQYQFFFMS